MSPSVGDHASQRGWKLSIIQSLAAHAATCLLAPRLGCLTQDGLWVSAGGRLRTLAQATMLPLPALAPPLASRTDLQSLTSPQALPGATVHLAVPIPYASTIQLKKVGNATDCLKMKLAFFFKL